MSFSGGRKDNENPEILTIQSSSRAHTKRTPLEWSQLGCFQRVGTTGLDVPYFVSSSSYTTTATATLGGFDQDSIMDDKNSSSSDNSYFPWIPITSEDKAVLKNLTDISHATRKGHHHQQQRHDHDSGVCLLESAGGLVIPTKRTASDVLKYSSSPVFPIMNDGGDFSTTTTTTKKNPNGSKDNKSNSSGSNKKSSVVPSIHKNPVAVVVDDEDEINAEEIFDIIRSIQDPEHPHTLEELGVVSLEQVELRTQGRGTEQQQQQGEEEDESKQDMPTPANKISAMESLSTVNIRFTPTIPHCSMATLIGLCIQVKLLRSLPPRRFQVSVQIEPGTHASENAINKQLRDKERVCAALENKHLAGVVNKCIRNE
jgi:metal-sulfur cluster biosynthetic enzyme